MPAPHTPPRLPAFPKKTLALLLPLALAALSSGAQAQFAVSPGTDNTAKTLGVGQAGSVAAGGTLSVNGLAINISGGTGAVTLTNNGVIATTNNTTRAIDNNNGSVAITFVNNGTLQSVLGDTFRINRAGSTINLTNLGTILAGGNFTMTNGIADTATQGQALDFRGITGGANVINNGDATHTNSLIQSNTDDAIRPGANTTITNYGTILSNSPINTKDVSGGAAGSGSAGDGIDAGGNTGVVVNNYGTISGARHGITADNDINVTNNVGGVIRGRNGSGVGSDGNGTVVNYGLISGDYAGAGNVYKGNDPSQSNGDGDGVDIDKVAHITNYGTIQGTGAGGLDDSVANGGQPNGSEGIAAGGGVILNKAGALIVGGAAGILIDDGKGGSTVVPIVAVSITNDGTIEGKNRAAIGIVGPNNDTIINSATGVIRGGANAVLVDAALAAGPGAAIQMGGGNDTLTNAGTIIGGNGLAVDMGSGDDIVNINGGKITGKVDGGSGANTLNFGGNFTSNGDFVNFTTTNVNSGTVRMAGVFQSTGAVNVANGATFIADNAFTTGNLSNSGTFAAAGTGTPRTITVTGNYTQGATGVFEVGIKGAGALDLLNVAGTATLANGATIKPVVLGGAYIQSGQSYTFINAGTLTATPAQLQLLNSSPLISFSLTQSGNNLQLTANRAASYQGMAGNGDAGAVGGALNSAGMSGQGGAGTAMGQLLGALDTQGSAGAVGNALNQLTPTPGSLVQGATNSMQQGFMRTVDERLISARAGVDSMTGMAAGDASGARRGWLRVFGNRAEQDARGGVDGYRGTSGGIAGGFDKSLDARTIVGLTVGAARSDINRSGALSGSGVDIDSLQLAVYGSRDYGGWYLEGSAGYGYNRYKSTRRINFVGFSQTARGDFDGHQFSARLGAGWLSTIDQQWAVRWLASGQVTHLRTDAYSESNAGAANLNVASSNATSVLSSLGAQLERSFGTGPTSYTGYVKAAWQHEFGKAMQTSASFAGGGGSFTVAGLTPARDAAILGFGVRGSDKKGFSLSAGYEAELRSQYTGHTVNVKAQWLF